MLLSQQAPATGAKAEAKIPPAAAQQTKAAAKPTAKKKEAKTVNTPAPPAVKYLTVKGDFARAGCDRDKCGGKPGHAVILDKDRNSLGEVKAMDFGKEAATFAYLPTSTTDPKYVVVGDSDPPIQEFSVQDDQVEMSETVVGDFCKDSSNPCTPFAVLDFTNVYVLAADDLEGLPGTVLSVAAGMVQVRFRAPRSFHPARLTFTLNGAAHPPVAFVAATPIQKQDLVYEHIDLKSICRKKGTPPEADCENTIATDLELSPLPSGAHLDFVSIGDGFLVAKVTSPTGEEPLFITVKNTDSKHSVLARRTIKPGQNGKLLHVDMTPVDQMTVSRDFGARIAKRYLIMSLDIKNPTGKKLQFRKSALYFDVDYAEAQQAKGRLFKDFAYAAEEFVTFGAYLPPDVYSAEFQPTEKKFLYGIDQNARHSSLNYLALLAAYDHTTEIQSRNFQAFELFGSVLSTIATSGMVAQVHNSAFKDAASVLTGVFTPGLRGVVLNVEGINRRRANLVSQTMQDVIQVAANDSTTTMVALPRFGILAIKDAETPVVVDRVLDVHIEPEVVSSPGEGVVPLLSLKVGYTREQVRQSLGEESGGDTNPDGSSYFTFRKGPYSRVNFGPEGSVVGSTSRGVPEEVDAASTLLEAMAILDRNSMTQLVHKITMVDGTVLLADVPGATKTFHYDDHGNRSADYTPKFDDIRAMADPAKSTNKKDFVAKLSGWALSTGSKQAIASASTAANGKKVSEAADFPSPDVQDGKISVRFKGKPTDKISDDSIVDSVSFQGVKPNSVKD